MNPGIRLRIKWMREELCLNFVNWIVLLHGSHKCGTGCGKSITCREFDKCGLCSKCLHKAVMEHKQDMGE